MDDIEICTVCGEDRDSDACCGLCLSCELDAADYDGDFCQPCHDATGIGDGDDEFHYYADEH